MKKQILFLALAILLAGCAAPPYSGQYGGGYGQGYGQPYGQPYGQTYGQPYGGGAYAPPPSNIYANPWVGANTPWTYYQGDWFLNGILYNFFGNQYGWAPYYSYPPTYIVRPNVWYETRYQTFYEQNPQYYQTFVQRYPHWRGHHAGQRYDQNFYNQHHRGQGEGWHKGYKGGQGTGTTGPGGQAPQITGPGGRGPRGTGPGGQTPGTTGPGRRARETWVPACKPREPLIPAKPLKSPVREDAAREALVPAAKPLEPWSWRPGPSNHRSGKARPERHRSRHASPGNH